MSECHSAIGARKDVLFVQVVMMRNRTLFDDRNEAERRRSPRKAFASEAWLECAGREYILTARDISESGMGATLASEPSLPSEAVVSFRLKPGNLPLVCRCRVVYSIDGKGLGVEFLDLSEECRAALTRFVDSAN